MIKSFVLAVAAATGSGSSDQGPIKVAIPESCAVPQVADLQNGAPWTEAQVESIKTASAHGCRDHFPEAPCVAAVIRTPAGTVQFTCDPENNGVEASAPGSGS